MTSSRRTWAIGAVVAFGLAAAAFGWNEAENASAREELRAACACADRSVEGTLAMTEDFFDSLFVDDAETVRADLRGEVSAVCAELRAELGPWRWNAGRTFRPQPAPERAARLRGALERARPRCPAALAGLPQSSLSPDAAESMCEELLSGMAPSPEPDGEVPLWDWPAVIDGSMCLPSGEPRTP